MNQWKLYTYKFIQIIAFACVIFILFLNNSQAKSRTRPACPNFEQIQTEISESHNFWSQVTDIRFKDPHASMSFMLDAVKKLYLSKKLTEDEKNKVFPKFKQDNCNSISLTYSNSDPVLYEIHEHSPYKVVINLPQSNDPLTEIILRVKHYYRRKTIEHVQRIKFSHERFCLKGEEKVSKKEESEIEITTLSSWYKEVPQKRVISERLLKLLAAQIKAEEETKKDPNRSIASERAIASCE